MRNFSLEQMFDFIVESNRIEGITRPPTDDEIKLTRAFLQLAIPTVQDLDRFVGTTVGAPMRLKPGMDVRVGRHVPPPGHPSIRDRLDQIVTNALNGAHPHAVHLAYEDLHPFMDGNGRSGRLLWAWQMVNQHGAWQTVNQNVSPGLSIGFLHTFYYQTLELASPRRR